MIKPERDIGERAYEEAHIEKVLSEIHKNFPKYFDSFSTKEVVLDAFESPYISIKEQNNKPREVHLQNEFNNTIQYFESEQPDYQSFLDVETLEEYKIDPNGFKRDFSTQVPIMNRCLNSSAKEMQRYRIEFNKKHGRELLNVTYNITLFAANFIKSFDDSRHEKITSLDELGLSTLLEDDYISYQVIGGGIKSHFLYFLYPHAFANRSQDALWALWYLTDKKTFGFEDDSEFLMIDVKQGTTQQNYHYPYDLFSLYALTIYRLLKKACGDLGITFNSKYRYIYLDTFLSFIAKSNILEIIDLKKSSQDEE